jgi:CheY-like chemotaxis protein
MTIDLPGAPDPETEPSRPAATLTAGNSELLASRTIVHIEDNLANIKLVELVLAHLPDTRLIPATRGRLGLELVREHQPDMVLVDLHLPDLDGNEVLEHLKADPATAQIPVVVLSADATDGQVERLLRAGAAEYLTKPLDVERLLDILSGALVAQD